MSVSAVVGRLGDLTRLALAPPGAVHYVGWTGHANLGDEAVRQAVEGLAGVPLVETPVGVHRVWRVAGRRLGSTVLGGGTLIGGGWLDPFWASLASTDHGVVLGSGVEDPRFWGPRGGLPEQLAAWRPVLERCDYVGVRGPRSAELLAGIGLDVEVFGDPVAQFARPGLERVSHRGLVAVNVGRSKGLMWGDEDDAVLAMADLVRLLDADGYLVELIVVWPDDLVVAHECLAMAGLAGVPLHECYDDPDAFMATAGRADVFVGMKLHAVALALCAGVPALMVEYRPKCRDFMQSIGLEEWTVRTDEASGGDLFERVAALRDDATEVAGRAGERLASYRELQRTRVAELGFPGAREPAEPSW